MNNLYFYLFLQIIFCHYDLFLILLWMLNNGYYYNKISFLIYMCYFFESSIVFFIILQYTILYIYFNIYQWRGPNPLYHKYWKSTLIRIGTNRFFVPEPKFGLSQRGNLVVQIGEWRFNKHACWGSKVRWTCIKKKSGCTAAITTVENVIVKTLGSHNHWERYRRDTRFT